MTFLKWEHKTTEELIALRDNYESILYDPLRGIPSTKDAAALFYSTGYVKTSTDRMLLTAINEIEMTLKRRQQDVTR